MLIRDACWQCCPFAGARASLHRHCQAWLQCTGQWERQGQLGIALAVSYGIPDELVMSSILAFKKLVSYIEPGCSEGGREDRGWRSSFHVLRTVRRRIGVWCSCGGAASRCTSRHGFTLKCLVLHFSHMLLISPFYSYLVRGLQELVFQMADRLAVFNQ